MADEPYPNSKTCAKCGQMKVLSAFYASRGCKYGRRPNCIECHNEARRARYEEPEAKAKRRAEYERTADQSRDAAREWRLRNLERARAKSRAWSSANLERHRQKTAAWRERNIDRLRAYSNDYHRVNRESVLRRNAQKRAENPEHFRLRDRAYIAAHPDMRRKIDAKRRSTPKGRLTHTVSQGIRRGLLVGAKAGRHCFDLVGYSVDDLKQELERKFLPGMTWENYGKWHIDHIVPLSAHNYSTPDCYDFKRAWALDNLRPLWAADNLRKSAKVLSPFQPSLL